MTYFSHGSEMTVKLRLLFTILSVMASISPAYARLIAFSPSELNFGSVEIGDTAWEEVRFRYAGADSGAGVVTIYTASNQCFGAYVPTPQGRKPHAFLDVIYGAIKAYRQDRGEDPTAVEEMVEIGYLSWPDTVSTQWLFSFIGRDPITQIEGVTVAAHPAGAGHVIRYDIQTARHSGWGLQFDGTFRLSKSDTYTARIWFVPKTEGDYSAPLSFEASFRQGRFTEDQSIYCNGIGSLGVNEAREVLPITDALLSAYPNPFNSTTTISFNTPAPASCRLVVFNMVGREVAVLHEGWSSAGEHRISWNAAGLPGGVYFPTLLMNGQSKSVRVVFIR